MTTELDCRGLACPAPVLQTRNVIEKEHPESIMVTVDNEAARENVSRFLTSQKYEVSVDKLGQDFCLTGKKDQKCLVPGTPAVEAAEAERRKIMVMVTTDRMGHGDDELGAKLLINFLKTLKEMGTDLWRLVFVNNGVKLAITGADALGILKDLEEEGVHILVCGTCLTHFDLMDKKQVGETTNMLDIVTAMQLADKVINI